LRKIHWRRAGKIQMHQFPRVIRRMAG